MASTNPPRALSLIDPTASDVPVPHHPFRITIVKPNTPRHADVDDRAEEKEHDELESPAFHDIILRHVFPSPAALGAALFKLAKQVVTAGGTVPDVSSRLSLVRAQPTADQTYHEIARQRIDQRVHRKS